MKISKIILKQIINEEIKYLLEQKYGRYTITIDGNPYNFTYTQEGDIIDVKDRYGSSSNIDVKLIKTNMNNAKFIGAAPR